MVQKKLISAKLENSEFTMESLDFIDAEKTNISEFGDDQLCWAASTSNMLRYTGWNTKAQEENPDEKFDSEDDILDLFNSVLINKKPHTYMCDFSFKAKNYLLSEHNMLLFQFPNISIIFFNCSI